MYPNLFFNDWLWAHMIRGAKWLHHVDWMKINDPALLSLLQMGVLDWKAPNNHLYQVTQVIWHRTAITVGNGAQSRPEYVRNMSGLG